MQGVPSLDTLSGYSKRNLAYSNLEFLIGTDTLTALLYIIYRSKLFSKKGLRNATSLHRTQMQMVYATDRFGILSHIHKGPQVFSHKSSYALQVTYGDHMANRNMGRSVNNFRKLHLNFL